MNMQLALLLAQEGGEKTLWDPTILGVITVLSAIGLFCGSVYLLLSTNLGARLGFLVAGACLSAFMVLLSGSWIITATPLNSPKGRPPAWHVREVVNDPSEAEIDAVRPIVGNGNPQDEEQLGQLRPAIEAALVTKTVPANEEAPSQPLAQFSKTTDLLTDFEGFQAYTMGGGTKNLFWHNNKYAAVQFCTRLQVEVSAGEAPPAPECDPLVSKQWAIMEFDFGSIRQPPWVYFGFSVV
ncbi:MAG TPA: hypothetical protein VFX21_17285, partial [Acidimicrobiia bacterium]|nr:hypothetical protein [Acidimicrobiia bacterium]